MMMTPGPVAPPATLLPLEIYEFVARVSMAKVVVIIVNAAIVWYLIRRVRNDSKHRAN